MADYRYLTWDTEFFGFAVAEISAPDPNLERLREIVSQLRQDGVKLAYWPAARRIGAGGDDEIRQLGGVFVDEKTTFLVELETAPKPDSTADAVIEPHHSGMPYEPLRSLVVQSGKYSRFAVDPRIPRDKFIEMYTIWLDRSLAGEMADEVLVVRQAGSPVGFITLGSKGARGDIGLIAVDRECRGKGYGEALVRSAQHWFQGRGFAHAQVITQGANEQACNLYRKCGYRVEKVEYFYHFWI